MSVQYAQQHAIPHVGCAVWSPASKSPLPFIVFYDWGGGLKIGKNILITCGLLYAHKQTWCVIHFNLFGYLHSCTPISSDISLCDSG